MAMSDSVLADALTNAVKNLTDATQAQNNVASALNDYVMNNVLASGIYIGVLPVGTPDPLSGPHKWKCTGCSVTGPLLLAAAAATYVGWVLSMGLQIQMTATWGGTADGVSLTPVKIASLVIDANVGMMSDRDSIMKIIAKAINNGLGAAGVSSGIGSAAGTGPVAITNLV